MKKYLFYISIVLLSVGLVSAKSGRKKPKPAFAVIETQYGNMKVKLYGETPLHKENFVTLVKEHFYDSLLFHRVIEDFMIQGGDPLSKNAKKGAMLGTGSHGDRIPAEFVDGLYHKRGALAAARDNNPEKKSSGCQFYIVQGKVYSNKDLDHIEEQHNASVKQSLLNNWLRSDESKADQEALTKLQRARNFAAFNHYCDSLVEHLVETNPDAKLFKFSPEQRKTYTTEGGAPFLDGDYTVFGEVVEGLNIIDSIAAVETDRNDRPLNDIIMKIKIVKK